MAMTDGEITTCAAEVADRMFVQANQTATHDVTTLKTMVNRIDQAMNSTGAQVNALYPGVALESAIYQHVSADVAGATVAQVALALAIWAMKRGGLI